jgi:outer membrane protein assembly factor BamB
MKPRSNLFPRLNRAVFTVLSGWFAVHAAASGTSADWPRFRGPDGRGVSHETGLPLEWNATKNVLWKTPLPGPGSSSAILFGDHVYVTSYSGYGLSIESPGNMAGLQRHLVCVDRRDGRVRWTATVPARGPNAPFTDPVSIGRHGYASSTPVADAGGVYVFYGTDGVIAYTHDGQERWRASCGDKVANYGSASSPLLFGGLVIVHAEIESQTLIALDQQTGRERWRIAKDTNPDTWSTPVIVTAKGRPEVLFSSRRGTITGADPRTGATLWECATRVGRINGSPAICDGFVVVLGSHSGNAAAVPFGGSGSVEPLWELNKGAYITSPVHYAGHLYWVKDGSFAYCIEARRGRVVYEERLRWGEVNASPVVADGRVYYVTRENGTYVLPAAPRFEVLAHNVIATDRSHFHGSPAISAGRIYLRSNQALYCIGAKP